MIITPKAISERPTIYILEITLKIQLNERSTQLPTIIANQTPPTQVTLAPSKESSYKSSTNNDIIFIWCEELKIVIKKKKKKIFGAMLLEDNSTKINRKIIWLNIAYTFREIDLSKIGWCINNLIVKWQLLKNHSITSLELTLNILVNDNNNR